jgi:hypothetical protein
MWEQLQNDGNASFRTSEYPNGLVAPSWKKKK